MGVLMLAACSTANAPTSTPPPTLTLVPATVTYTPTPVTPTATRVTLPGPSDLVTPTPDGGLAPTPRRALDNLLQNDPIAADLVSLAQRRIADQLGLATSRIRIVDVTPYEWTDSSLGCPQSGQQYVAVQVVGYRIVLSAGDSEYVFHTDGDQIIPCPSGNEVLPE